MRHAKATNGRPANTWGRRSASRAQAAQARRLAEAVEGAGAGVSWRPRSCSLVGLPYSAAGWSDVQLGASKPVVCLV
jgi:hypothetical protein